MYTLLGCGICALDLNEEAVVPVRLAAAAAQMHSRPEAVAAEDLAMAPAWLVSQSLMPATQEHTAG